MSEVVQHLDLKPGAMLHIVTELGTKLLLQVVSVEREGTQWSPRMTVDFGPNGQGFSRPHEVMMYASDAIGDNYAFTPLSEFVASPAPALRPGTTLMFADESPDRKWNRRGSRIASVTVDA